MTNPTASTSPRPSPSAAAPWGRRLRLGLAPAVLLLVALGHSYWVETTHLTPWEGGGFGMFSTVDRGQARFVRCVLLTPEGEVRVSIPAAVRDYVWRLQVLPDSARTQRLADVLAQAPWERVPSAPSPRATSPRAAQSAHHDASAARYRIRPAYAADRHPRADVQGVRVEVWRYRFHPDDASLDAHRLVQATSERQGNQ